MYVIVWGTSDHLLSWKVGRVTKMRSMIIWHIFNCIIFVLLYLRARVVIQVDIYKQNTQTEVDDGDRGVVVATTLL